MAPVIKATIRDTPFTYSTPGLLAYSLSFAPNPSYSDALSVTYFKAQLAFRGFSQRDRDIEALKSRLSFAVADMGTRMNPEVARKGKQMKAEFTRRVREEEREEQERAGETEEERERDAQSEEGDADIARKGRLEHKWANRVIDEDLAQEEPREFLRHLFFDKRGRNKGGPPVVL